MAGNYESNSDGLVQHYGPLSVANNARGPESKGAYKEVKLTIVGTELSDAASTGQLVNCAVIPSGAHIVSGELYVTTAFAGATAVLDIGVYNASSLAAVDDDGIDAAIAVGSLTDNAQISSNGALIDTTLAQNSVIAASYDTAAFTAGVATLVVTYFVPEQ